MTKLTTRQQQVLSFISTTIKQQGMPPTRAEIAEHLGFRSPNAAEEHLKALARKGAIEMIPGASRGIRVPKKKTSGIPVIGRVAAGLPILAQENIEQFIDIAPTLFHPAADFFLEVQGDSMKKIGILNKDLIAVHHTQNASNNQIIVARINDEVTVKRYKRSQGKVQLLPENDDYQPIEINLQNDLFCIEGLYVGILRGQA